MKKLFVAVTIACLGTILVSVSAQTLSPSPDVSAGEEGIANENTDGTEQCDCPSSPDGKYAFLTSETEKDSFENQVQMIDLIDKKSGKKLQRIDETDMHVFWTVVLGARFECVRLGRQSWRGIRANKEWRFTSEAAKPFVRSNCPIWTRGYTKKEVVWTPDSRRFALNYTISWWRGYETVAFYQLRDDKWVPLRSPVDEASKHSQLAQLARKYSPKNTDRKGDSALLSNHLEARRWTDANTLLLYAYSEEENGEAAALFTLKFDEAGNWKVVKMHRMSEKELKEER